MIAMLIADTRRREQCAYADFAVLYRTNAQSRVIEDALRSRGIAYKVYGSQSFYQRKEVKDIIAYFRMAVNPHDEEALKRIINFPARGIGDATVGKLVATASTYQVSAWAVVCSPAKYNLPVNEGTLRKLREFGGMIQELIEENAKLPAVDMAEFVVKRSGIMAEFFQDRSVEGISRQENLQEVLKAIAEFSNNRREEGSEQVSLTDFLVEVSLITDQDQDAGEHADKATLMTVHAAKGLEFDHVVVAGMEENLFPSSMSTDKQSAIEEERRLCYVAITRAKKSCTITYARSRFRNGKTGNCVPSRFLTDIDPQFIDMPDERTPAGGETMRERTATAGHYWPQNTQRIQTPPLMHRLQSGSSPAEENIQTSGGFSVGDDVCHVRFGKGKILSFEGRGGDARAIVAFEHFGKRTLLLKYAQLTKN
jgi:DNA helicase-2/ATP-dependent DNA helicase PcrA